MNVRETLGRAADWADNHRGCSAFQALFAVGAVDKELLFAQGTVGLHLREVAYFRTPRPVGSQVEFDFMGSSSPVRVYDVYAALDDAAQLFRDILARYVWVENLFVSPVYAKYPLPAHVGGSVQEFQDGTAAYWLAFGEKGWPAPTLEEARRLVERGSRGRRTKKNVKEDEDAEDAEERANAWRQEACALSKLGGCSEGLPQFGGRADDLLTLTGTRDRKRVTYRYCRMHAADFRSAFYDPTFIEEAEFVRVVSEVLMSIRASFAALFEDS